MLVNVSVTVAQRFSHFLVLEREKSKTFLSRSLAQRWTAVFPVSQKTEFFSWCSQRKERRCTKIRSSLNAVQSTTPWTGMVIPIRQHHTSKSHHSINPIFFILPDTYTCNADGEWTSAGGSTEMPKCTEGKPSRLVFEFE